MKNIFLNAAAAVALSAAALGSAHAQSAVNWTGPYFGWSAGGSWTHTDTTLLNTTTGARTHANLRASGPQFGLIGGYDYMLPWNMVVGGAIDAYVADISTSTSTLGQGKTNGLGSARLRVGYPVNVFLPYLTGGLAWQHTRTSLGSFGHDSDTRIGWTVGGGVDYALGNLIGITNLVLGAEYRYSQIRDEHFSFPAATTSVVAQHVRSHMAVVNLTYHFGMTPPPPPPATPVVAAPPAPPAPVAPQKQVFIVFFEFDKSALTADGKRVVDAAAAAYKSGKSNVAIAGYTDLAGTAQYNLALSKRRADTVRTALVRDGVPAAAIAESWHGKESPRVPTADGVREPQNRRVEINM
jgi:outer membrane protein OmpA-like peptidoglycan-associated protein